MKSSKEIVHTQAVHMNLPQLEAFIVNANITVVEAGRGVGKTTGMLAPRILHNAKKMPRSSGFYAGPSYRKIIDDLWPGLRKGFESLGMTEYSEDNPKGDFVFLKTPPKHFQRPYMVPGSFQHYLSFANGSGLRLISFDYKSTANGQDNDYGVLDECKLLNPQNVSEVLLTLRGNAMHFGKYSEHLGLLLLSDKYVSKKDYRWLDSYKQKAIDKKKINEIILLQHAYQKYLAAGTERSIIIAQALANELNEMRRDSIHYLEAKTIENIDALGWKYILNQYKSLTPHKFLVSVDNKEIKKPEGDLFYNLYSEDIHGYSNQTDNERLDQQLESSFYDYEDFQSKRSSLLDKDCYTGKELKLLVDFGSRFNWAVINQLQGNVVKAINEIIIESPKKARDLALEFCNYYRFHKTKRVDFYYDIDGNKQSAYETATEAERFIEVLIGQDWIVNNKCKDLYKYPSHNIKYKFWQYVMDNNQGRDNRFPMFQLNTDNCKYLNVSISGAFKKDRDNIIQKDKSDEKKIHTIDQRTTTHLSDAQDWLILDYIHLLDDGGGFSISMH